MHVISISVPQAFIIPYLTQKGPNPAAGNPVKSLALLMLFIFKLDTLSKMPCDKWKAELNSEGVSN